MTKIEEKKKKISQTARENKYRQFWDFDRLVTEKRLLNIIIS